MRRVTVLLDHAGNTQASGEMEASRTKVQMAICRFATVCSPVNGRNIREDTYHILA
jgi:hypothetical protein